LDPGCIWILTFIRMRGTFVRMREKDMMTAVSREMLAALAWYIENGVDEAVENEPTNRFRLPVAVQSVPNISPVERKPSLSVAVPAPVFGKSEARGQALALAQAAQNLDDLRAAILAFDGIGLKKTATNMVFSDGNPKAPIMLVGEAPGADEDRLGKPFVGVSGRLLDGIFKTIGLDRQENDPARSLYISNILNWRPPGNRTPSPAEIEVSLPFIERHIQLVKPKLLILCGGVAAQALLGRSDSVSKLRKTWHDYQPQTSEFISQSETIPAIVMYHPSYLLRTPSQKKAAWADIISIKQKSNIL
ncbi:MAG: uracil-DNA glycosylase, partial [Alphaproteobacteria bacterium]